MAITLIPSAADHSHASQTTTTSSQSSTSFTPTAGNLLVVLIDITILTANIVAAGSMMSDTFGDTGGGSWTQFGIQEQTYGTFTVREAIYARTVGTSPGAGTITVKASNTAGVGVEQDSAFYELSGSATSAAQNKPGHGAANTVTIALTSAPASTSILFGVARADTAANVIGTPSGWTATQSLTDGNGDTHFAGFKNGSGAQSNAFTATSSGGNDGIDALVVEIAVSSGGPTTNTIPAKARIKTILTAGQPAKARIKTILTNGQPAKARVKTTLTSGQPAKARVSTVLTSGQPAKARVKTTLASGQPAKANILGPSGKTNGQPAKARIQTVLTSGQPAKARIQATLTSGQPAKARVSTTLTSGQPGKARIAAVRTSGEPAKSRIKTVGLTATEPAKAKIGWTRDSLFYYGGGGQDLADGSGVWVNPPNARGPSDSVYATWAATAVALPFAASVSSNGRNVLDQFGQPWLMIGDTAFDLCTTLTTLTDWTTYFSTRKTQGFNAVYMNIIAGTYDGALSTWKTADGIPPFYTSDGVTPGTGPGDYDISKPYPAFFARVDTIVALAASYGMTMFINPADAAVVDQPDNSGFIAVQGTTKCTAYGTFLGNRYKTAANVHWQHGNDYGLAGTSWSLDSYLGAIANGIRAAMPKALQSIELNYNFSTSFDNANWRPGASEPMDLDGVYDYSVCYDRLLNAYNQKTASGSSTGAGVVPVYFLEGVYEDAAFPAPGSGDPSGGSPLLCRMLQWYTLTCGAIGGWYGNGDVFQFNSAWKTSINHDAANQMGYASALRSYNWHNLVPDGATPNLLSSQSVGSFVSSTTAGTASQSWASAAVTTVGDLGVVYTPVHQNLVVDMTKMRGTVTARWYDVTNGTYTAIGSFANTGTHTFTPSATNAYGDADWLLVLTA